ncbi:hypothetical protein [Jeotgalibacillus haloalkalitolerans]|uniref:Uncharacterized protein n=1 Tax=Jeotgalibacillus haloalkalitolerans TaxID=3104292 RepID=A0ABU5KJL6_9BACL|nr:hypothetical protein [Jeotgalibacillus sp. HH7-29]MDZ5711283.1 hypothetical protein [Jeotgalibacillus sp. HH7-29]
MQKEILFESDEQHFYIQSMQPSNVRNVSLAGMIPGSRNALTIDDKKRKPLQ